MSVVALRNRLTQDDIRRLVKGETDEVRAMAARKICRRMDSANLTEMERDAARGILELIARDAAELVRRALAVTLRQSPNLPREIALKLALDVDAVALPVLENSPVLQDEDLLRVLEHAGTEKRCAVAGRERVAPIIVHELLDSRDERAHRPGRRQ